MANQTHMFHGKTQLMRRILEFVAGFESVAAQPVLRVWRTLSRADRKVADDTATLPSVADHVLLRFNVKRPELALKKLDFFIDTFFNVGELV